MNKRELVQIENISVEELTDIIAYKLADKIETRIAILVSSQNQGELLTRAKTAEVFNKFYNQIKKKNGNPTRYSSVIL